MYQNLRADAETIVRTAIAAVLPDEAVRRALKGPAGCCWWPPAKPPGPWPAPPSRPLAAWMPGWW